SPRDRQILVRVQERLRNGKAMVDGPSLPPAPGTPNTPGTTIVKGDYKSLLTAARSALQRGELEMAEALCVQAEKVGRNSWLLPGGGDKNPGLSGAQRTEQARQLVRQARYALQINDVDTARRLLMQVREMHPELDVSDADNPTRLLAEIQRGTPSVVSTRINP